MNATKVEEALRLLGEALTLDTDVEILLVGGAAGMVTGVFRSDRTTNDCDVMVCSPDDMLCILEDTASRLAPELGLTSGWFNSRVQLRLDTLPGGWRERRIHVGLYGRLFVYAASRPDLLAMKVFSGRTQDIEDLHDMSIREDEATFVHAYLDSLPPRGTPMDQIEQARRLLEGLHES